MKNHRFLTFTGAGSLIAAVLALSFFLVAPGPRSTVEAKTIFNSLRQALNSAFEVTIENVSVEGLHLDGHVGIVLGGDADAIKVLDAPPRGAYAGLKIAADETADPDVAGAKLQIAAAMVDTNAWAYLQIDALPPAILEEVPPAAIVANLARNGLLLDLDGIVQENPFTEFVAELSYGSDDHESDTEGTPSSPSSNVKKEVRIEVSGHGGTAPAPHQQHEGADLDDTALRNIHERLFTGQATVAELQDLVTLLESAADQATIVQTEPGRYLLTVSGLDIDENDVEGQALLGAAVIEIAYQEGVGVEWLQISHLGPDDGRILVEMTDLTIDDALFKRERYLADPQVLHVDLAGLLRFFGEKQ